MRRLGPLRHGRIVRKLLFSGIGTKSGSMKNPQPPLLLVPFREVRHLQPDDCLHYETVGERAEQYNWSIPAHRHEGLHQFQLLERGSIHGMIDGQACTAEAPAMLLLAPGSVHAFTYTPDAVAHQLTIPTATLQQLLEGSSLADNELGSSFVLSGADIELCARHFATMAQEFREQNPGRVYALLAYASLVAVQFLRKGGEQPASEARRGVRDTLVARYRALIEKHFREHPSLNFYAGALAVSVDHLSRICRNVTGNCAQQILHERRMLEARRLLTYSPMQIAEVAAQLGYKDAAYFTKFFARTMGETPSQYRTSVAKGLKAGRS